MTSAHALDAAAMATHKVAIFNFTVDSLLFAFCMLAARNIVRNPPACALNLAIEIPRECSLNVLTIREGALQKEDFIHRLQEALRCQLPRASRSPSP